jgi:hypothetical protein
MSLGSLTRRLYEINEDPTVIDGGGIYDPILQKLKFKLYLS